MKKWYGFIVIVAVTILWTSVVSAADDFRLNGENRHETAVEISKEGWDDATHVVIARSDDFPDALAGAPLAYQLDAPILLTPQHTLHESVASEIERLGAHTAVILGGFSAVNEDVENELRSLESIDNIDRIHGANRFDTALQIAERMNVDGGAGFVVDSHNYPDALAVAPYAAERGFPILLTRTDSIPKETQKALEYVDGTFVIGGKSAVSDDVFDQLPNAGRLEGSDRYQTAYAVIDRFYDDNITHAFVATGEDFADALAGSVLAAKAEQPIILTRTNRVASPVYSVLYNSAITDFTFLGGESALSSTLYDEMQNPDYDQLVFDHPEINEYASSQYFEAGSNTLLFRGIDSNGNEFSRYRLNEDFNPAINRQIYDVAASVLDPERYTRIEYWKEGNNSRAIVDFAPQRNFAFSGSVAFSYMFYEGNQTLFFGDPHPLVSLSVNRLWFEDWEYARHNDLMEPEYAEPLKKSIHALFTDTNTANAVHSFIIQQFKRAAEDREQETFENHTVNGVNMEVQIFRGYPEFYFYNLK